MIDIMIRILRSGYAAVGVLHQPLWEEKGQSVPPARGFRVPWPQAAFGPGM